ncbi:MAG: hypothetical protein AAB152_05130 [Candidatus Coatesbacteria bacterium]
MDAAAVRPRAVAFLLAAAALAAGGWFLFRPRDDIASSPRPWVNHDVAQLLVLGRQFAAGDRPYLDWIDPNLPAVHVASHMVIRLERETGIRAVYLYHAGVLLLALLGCWVLAALTSPLGTWRAVAVITAYLGIVFCPTIPATSDFGQREHILTLVLLPWLVWRTRLGAEPSPVLRGLLAFLLGWWGGAKLVYLAVPLAVEALRWRTGPRLRALEAVCFTAGLAASVVLCRFLWPGALTAFVTTVLPLLSPTRPGAAFTIPLRGFLGQPQLLTGAAGTAVLALLLWRARRRGLAGAAECRAWGAATVAAAIAMVIQRKGFAYHAIPLTGIVVMGAILALCRVTGGRVAATAAAAFAVLCFASFRDPGRFGLEDVTPLTALARPGEAVMVCSTDVLYSRDADHLGLRLAGPWGIHFALAGVLAEPDPGRRAAALAAYRARMTDSISRLHCGLVLVREVPVPGCGTLEDALRPAGGFLPPGPWRRLAPADVQRRFGGDGAWVVYRRGPGIGLRGGI